MDIYMTFLAIQKSIAKQITHNFDKFKTISKLIHKDLPPPPRKKNATHPGHSSEAWCFYMGKGSLIQYPSVLSSHTKMAGHQVRVTYSNDETALIEAGHKWYLENRQQVDWNGVVYYVQNHAVFNSPTYMLHNDSQMMVNDGIC